MDTLTYARPDSAIRFHRLALGALILTLYPITQLIWRWIAFPLLQRFAPGAWLQIGNFLPYMFGAAILLAGVCVISTTFKRAQSAGLARVAALTLAALYFMTNLLANGIALLGIVNHRAGTSIGNDMLHAAWVLSALGSFFLALLLILAIPFMFRIAFCAGARWVGILGAVVLALSATVTLLFIVLYVIYLGLDLSSAASASTFRMVDQIGRIASLIHQLAELLLWSTITLWAFRRTSA